MKNLINSTCKYRYFLIIMAVDSFSKVLQSLLDSLEKTEHDNVVRASAASYTPDKLNQLGLKIDTNIDAKNRFVGDAATPLYPDIVVWQPAFPTSTNGKAVLIEKIETKNSIEKNWFEWSKFANIGVIFTLIFPPSETDNVKGKLNTLGLSGKVRLQTYNYNDQTKQYAFTNVN